MAIKLRRVNPFEMREPLVQFFWRMQAWPLPTKEDYYRLWDWRYTSLSESVPVVWAATEGDTVVGHLAINFRHLRFHDQAVRVGVPGNFLVDENCRNPMIAARLAGSPRTLVRDGDLDMVLGYGNKIAHAMFTGLGSRDLGQMHSLVDIRQWDPVLARRGRAAALLAPVVRLGARARKAVLRRKLPPRAEGLVARPLSFEEVVAMDRSHWTHSDGLVWDGSATYFARRFLKCPIRTLKVYGVMDERTGRLEGLVVTEGKTLVTVWECDVNESVVSEVQAVELALDATPWVESVSVPLLPHAALAADFASAGFIRRFRTDQDEVAANTWWAAYSEPTHPLAALFADTNRWKLWYGWNHH